MTKSLEDAFREASKLPEQEQDAVAAAILAEMEADRAWASSLASSESLLGDLADEALQEHRTGETETLDPNTL